MPFASCSPRFLSEALRDIDQSIAAFERSGADSMISVSPIPHQYNPHWAFEAVEGTDLLRIATGETSIISRRQDLPAAYHRDGSIYLAKCSVILTQRSMYGQSIAAYRGDAAPINIDTEDDWQAAEDWIARGGV